MPKTSVHENDFTSGWEHHVGLSGQAGNVKPIAVTHTVNKVPDHHLRFRVCVPHQPHALAALLGAHRVHLAPTQPSRGRKAGARPPSSPKIFLGASALKFLCPPPTPSPTHPLSPAACRNRGRSGRGSRRTPGGSALVWRTAGNRSRLSLRARNRASNLYIPSGSGFAGSAAGGKILTVFTP